VRLPLSRPATAQSVPGAASESPASAGSSEAGLLGGWSATRWEYTRARDPGTSVDLVCDLGGSVSLSLSAGRFILTCEVAGRGSLTVSGQFLTQDDQLHFTALESGTPQTVRFHQVDRTLSLYSAASAWDFDGQGEQPAEFVAVLVRL
jgi:hypothetical protein